IMTETLTLEKIIAFLKVDLTFACCWPLPMKATKFQKIRNKIFRLLCCLNSIIMIISLIYTLNRKYDNMIFVMKVGCELTAFVQVPIQITLFTLQSDRLQIIIYEMEDYIQQAKSEERNTFQRYINKCKLVYGTTMCFITVTAIIMSFGPLFLAQPFPIEVEYPFDVNKQPLRTIIYLHHMMIIYQSCVQVCSNVFVALLLWFTAARFEILFHKFQKITSISEFTICIQLHQQLLRYAKDVTMTIRYVVLSTIGFCTIGIVFSGLTFLSIATFEIVNFCNVMKPHEEVVIQRYIDKCIIFYGTSIFIFYWFTFTAITVIPALEHQPFPTLAEYPFDVSYQPVKTIIFMQQSMAGIMVAGQLCMNVYMAMLLWFASARFEILTKELEKTANVYQLFKCIKKHQKLLIYAKDVTMTVRYIALSTVGFSSIAVIFSGLTFLTSNDIGHAGYESSWYNKEISLQKNLLYTVSRCQHPVTLTVPCLLPSLSLNYYASNVICEMEDYYKQANTEEKDVFQQYINKYILFYGTTLTLTTAITFAGCLIVPLIRSRKFPLEIEYPFRVDYQPITAMLYFHQVLGMYQVTCQVSANVFLALLIWFTTARFEILTNKFRTVTKYSDWKICIQEHQVTLRFAKEMSSSIALVVLSSLGVSTIALIFGGVTFLSRFPLSVKLQYIVVCLTSLVKVFLCAWPADHLMRISSNVAEAAYDSLWYNQNIESQKIMLHTLLRCQRAVVISVPGLLKALTFQQYTSYVSTAFSYLTTFRIILSEET
ncbi:OR22C protein, partial [Acromyrmex heyeri]